MSRRTVLGGLALGGAALTPGLLLPEADAAARQGSLPHNVDTVVVGGGITGLVTAHRLAQHGRDVRMVERR